MDHAVIMAGGKGTRFWPLSRSVRAKQFLDIVGNDSLLVQTIKRLNPLVKPENIWVAGNEYQSEYLKAESEGLISDHILYEPEGKNTAPSIGWSAMKLLKEDSEAVMMVLPADHIIKESDIFREKLKLAIDLVKKENCLVMIGIKPDSPHTGYGYIEVGHVSEKGSQVKSFHEKPDKDTAEQYISTGRFFWNSGIFVWRASKIVELMKKYSPRNYTLLKKIDELDISSVEHKEKLAALYAQMDNISIDYAIMEKAYKETKMIPAAFTWNDIGNWTALEDFWEKDSSGNAAKGSVISIDSSNNIVNCNGKLVTLIGVDNMLVINSDDALLILPRESDQRIRELYEKLPPEYK
ncbi:MAG: mannose-1-phosphate guanylyltransferase [bacterium]|nr:mannose-1-phosphate guanylyltransferase [bacterium]